VPLGTSFLREQYPPPPSLAPSFLSSFFMLSKRLAFATDALKTKEAFCCCTLLFFLHRWMKLRLSFCWKGETRTKDQ
jgi:hypothetical protein